MAKISVLPVLVLIINHCDLCGRECVGGSKFVGVLHLIDYYILTHILEN